MVNANVSGDFNDAEQSNDDPVEILQKIDNLEGKLNTVENTTAVSVVFLMKSSGVQVTVSGQDVNELLQLVPCGGNQQCEDVKTTADVLLNQSQSLDASFWDLLNDPDAFGLPASQQSQIFLLDVFYASLTKETREIFVSEDFSRSLIYVDMPFIPVADTAKSVDMVNEMAGTFQGRYGETAEDLTGVAATAIEVNELIVGSQWTSLGFAIILTLITLAVVFRDIRYSIWTTSPVIATVALQWLVMWQMDVPLSLVTVMIGSILVGVGVDFSIHIANRIRELGGGIQAIEPLPLVRGCPCLKRPWSPRWACTRPTIFRFPKLRRSSRSFSFCCGWLRPARWCYFLPFSDAGENGYWCRQRWQQHGEETRPHPDCSNQ